MAEFPHTQVCHGSRLLRNVEQIDPTEAGHARSFTCVRATAVSINFLSDGGFLWRVSRRIREALGSGLNTAWTCAALTRTTSQATVFLNGWQAAITAETESPHFTNVAVTPQAHRVIPGQITMVRATGGHGRTNTSTAPFQLELSVLSSSPGTTTTRTMRMVDHNAADHFCRTVSPTAAYRHHPRELNTDRGRPRRDDTHASIELTPVSLRNPGFSDWAAGRVAAARHCVYLRFGQMNGGGGDDHSTTSHMAYTTWRAFAAIRAGSGNYHKANPTSASILIG
jgi:hypothetical protein